MLSEMRSCVEPAGAFPLWESLPKSGYRQSAVLVLLYGSPKDLRIVLIRRPLHLNRHAGEIAFPGGKREAGDVGPVQTALREAREELGIDPGKVRLCGLLEREFAFSSDFEIYPVLARMDPTSNPSPRVDRNEVSEVLLEGASLFARPPRLEWGRHGYVHFIYPVFDTPQGTRIWGATARILWQLGRRVATSSPDGIPPCP